MRNERCRAQGRRGHGGFSLVELLIVVGVLAILSALLLAAIGRAQSAARAAKCQNNLGQIYKAIRIYTNSSNQILPDLFNSLETTEHLKRYVNSNAARSEVVTGPPGDPVTTQVAAGLWLLYTGKYADAKDVFYCPETPGPRRYGGTANALIDGLPERLGYMYNCYPESLLGADALLPPDDLTLEEVSNDVTQQRSIRFYAFLSDVFLKSNQLTHVSRKGMSCCYWDGSVQWISLSARTIPWNSSGPDPDNPAKTISFFTEDMEGATAARDTWVMLSEARR